MTERERILIVDDEPDMVRLIRVCLERGGYRVASVGDAETALDAIKRSEPSLVVLDVVLPGMSGIELLRRLRKFSRVPVILLSGRGGEADRTLGIEAGADDYVGKPFSMKELQARIEARLRPKAGPAAPCADGLVIDRARRRALVKGKTVRLAEKEYAILELLEDARGSVLSREELLAMVWGRASGERAEAVDERVAALRRKLGQAGARIAAVSRQGYRLTR